MTNPIQGIDVSSWQHPNGVPIDWEKVYNAGYQFAVVKATQGTQYVNPWVVKDISDANAAGLLVGAYHYYEAGEDPLAQAKWFTSNLIMQQLDLGCFVDWECYAPKQYTYTQELVNFLTEARLTRTQTGIYCSMEWATQLEAESVNTGRLWLRSELGRVTNACFMSQVALPVEVAGIVGDVDVNGIVNTRGLDIPTAPPAPRQVETLYSLKEAEEQEDIEALQDHTPADDDD